MADVSPASVARTPASPREDRPPLKIIAKACQSCRARKTRCDTQRPRCGTCTAHGRHCIYALEPPKRRPSTTLVNALQEEKSALEQCIIALKNASPDVRARVLDAVEVIDGKVRLPNIASIEEAPRSDGPSPEPGTVVLDESGGLDTTDEDYDPSNFLALDERGHIGVYGPTSALHGSSPRKCPSSGQPDTSEHSRNQLIANAALQRQKEHALGTMLTIGGEPSELAMHLLHLHWNRQHHTFLLTYRPAIMRDLVAGGPCCSDFLLNAIFACVSKFSGRVEVRDDPSRPETAGRRFFIRCEQMLGEALNVSSIPTIVGLLLLGSTFNARGLASKGWLYTGYALRMVYDLGLHLDCKEVGGNAEEIEIRRRVFWGAFVCDKLQSLYLGRPVTIQLRDAHVSLEFMDTLEEQELWTPYIDPHGPASEALPAPTPIHSVSTFQQFCLLSKIITRIVNRFYVLGATARNTASHLESVNEALANWYQNLPSHLVFEPWTETTETLRSVPPNNILLLTTFNALVILLHRPFVFDGHLRATNVPALSRNKCTTAAHNITSLASAYKHMYTLRRAPYLLSYAAYVASTIHARNTASEGSRRQEDITALVASLKCLDELTVPNSGVSNPAGIIRRLMAVNGIPVTSEILWDEQIPGPQELDTLCRLFPSATPDHTECSQSEGFVGYGGYGFDSLQSFIEMYMPPTNENMLGLLDPSLE